MSREATRISSPALSFIETGSGLQDATSLVRLSAESADGQTSLCGSVC